MRHMSTKFQGANSCSLRDKVVHTNIKCSICCLLNRCYSWLIMKTLHSALEAIKPGRAAAAAARDAWDAWDTLDQPDEGEGAGSSCRTRCRTTWALCRSVCKVFTDRQRGKRCRRAHRVANACMEYQFIIHLREKLCTNLCARIFNATFNPDGGGEGLSLSL